MSWQQHPLYGLMPYEALFDGGDPEAIDDEDVREPAVAHIERMAERIVRYFDMARAIQSWRLRAPASGAIV